MARKLVVIDRETPLLMAPTIQEWVGKDDMARFVIDAVELVSEEQCHYNWRGTGSAQYPPRMMLALLIYCYSSGVFSSRKIQSATYRDIAVRFITGDTHPDHDTIAAFRRDNEKLFKSCFTRVLELAGEMKIKRVGTVSIDGTKIVANAAKRRTLTQEQLEQHQLELDQKVSELTRQAEAADKQEQGRADGDRLAKELQDAVKRREMMKEALAQLKQQHQTKVAERQKQRETFDSKGPGEPPRKLSPEPKPEASMNLTDPDARLLPQKRGGYAPSYNTQIAVAADSQCPLILATGVCDQSNDRQQLEPMVEAVMAAEKQTDTILVDTGYDNSGQIWRMESKHGCVVFCPPEERQKKKGKEGRERRNTKQRKATQEYREGMRAAMRSETGRKSQRLRATTVEPVIGWIKETLGFKRFLLRGMEKVKTEWNLVCLGANLRMMHRVMVGRKDTAVG
jgi:transposase